MHGLSIASIILLYLFTSRVSVQKQNIICIASVNICMHIAICVFVLGRGELGDYIWLFIVYPNAQYTALNPIFDPNTEATNLLSRVKFAPFQPSTCPLLCEKARYLRVRHENYSVTIKKKK